MPFEKGITPEGAIPFQPGESGNKNGRPLGSKNRSTTVQKWLSVATKVINPDTDEVETGTFEDKMILAILAKAITDKDVNAAKELLDSAYGKAAQTTNTNISGSLLVPFNDEQVDKILNKINDTEGSQSQQV